MPRYDAANTSYHPGTTGPKELDTENDVVWEFPDSRTKTSEEPEAELMTSNPSDLPTANLPVDIGLGFSAPAIADGAVYAVREKNIYAIDVETGEEIWSSRDKLGYWSAPVVMDGVVYVGSEDRLYGLDGESGEEVWILGMEEGVGGLRAKDGVVYASSDKLYAIDTESREEIWSFEHSPSYLPAVKDGVAYVPGPGSELVTDPETGRDEIVRGPDHNVFFALDAETGEEMWEFRLNNSFEDEPVVSDERVYVPDRREGFWALDLETGEEDWFFDMNDPAHRGLAFAEGTVYVSSSEGTQAVDPETGDEIWSHGLGGPVSVADGVVYIEGTEIHAVDATTGETLIGPDALTGAGNPAPVLDGYIYARSGDSIVKLGPDGGT